MRKKEVNVASAKAKKSAKTKKTSKPVKKAVKKISRSVKAKSAKKAVKKTTAKKSVQKTIKKTLKTPMKTKKTLPKKSAKAVAKTNFTPVKVTNKATKIQLKNFFSPLDDRIFVNVSSEEKRTAGGLYIPETASASPGYFEGEVVACGPGHKDKKGRLKPLDVKLGDKILFSEYSGQKMTLTINDQALEYYVVRESDVLGIKN